MLKAHTRFYLLGRTTNKTNQPHIRFTVYIVWLWFVIGRFFSRIKILPKSFSPSALAHLSMMLPVFVIAFCEARNMWQHGLSVLIEKEWDRTELRTLALFHVWVGALQSCRAQVCWLRAYIFLYSCLTQCGSVYLVEGVRLINKLCPRQPLHTLHSAVIF